MSRDVSPEEAQRRRERALLVPTVLDSEEMIDYALDYLACTGDFSNIHGLRDWAQGCAEYPHDPRLNLWGKKFLDATEGHVYFVASDTEPVVKIGFSLDVEARLPYLHFRWGDSCTLWGMVPGGRLLETVLHRRFKQYCVEGEWFEFADEVTDYIRECLWPKAGKAA